MVTGAASGLGHEFVLGLASSGASVAAVDLDQRGLDALLQETADVPGRVRSVRADVTNEAQVADAIATAASDFGLLNGVINNAGIYRDGLLVRKIGEKVIKLHLAQWGAVIDTDLTGPFLVAREIASHMVQGGVSPGVIINISSVMRRGNAGQSNYSAAKAGVAALTKVWAEELAPYGIRVATIAPGFIQTPILDGTAPEVIATWMERVPMRRLGEAAEIFEGVKFVIRCDYFTGKCLDIDGGLSI